MKNLKLFAVPLGLAILLSNGCSRKEGSPAGGNAAQAAAHSKVKKGAEFNRLFPLSGGGYEVTFTQEKDGFAQADLSKSGAKLAQMSISDTEANPSARDKFEGSQKQVAGYPIAAAGEQGTALLVANRYQVQIRSTAPAFSAADREAWLAKFKLSELK